MNQTMLRIVPIAPYIGSMLLLLYCFEKEAQPNQGAQCVDLTRLQYLDNLVYE